MARLELIDKRVLSESGNEFSLVAEEGGRIVGHIRLSHVDLDDGEKRHRVSH